MRRRTMVTTAAALALAAAPVQVEFVDWEGAIPELRVSFATAACIEGQCTDDYWGICYVTYANMIIFIPDTSPFCQIYNCA
jgi:hypothetical protein